MDNDRLIHSYNVGLKMIEIGKTFNLTEEQLQELFVLGLNHDIGYQFGDNSNHNIIGGEILKKSNYKYYKEVYYHGELTDEYHSLYLDILNMADMQIDKYGNEYWLARELQKALEYKEWRNFKKAISIAIESCKASKNNVSDYFVKVNKIVKTGISEKKIEDYKLSRYACYLIVQNDDSRKEVVALGQTYFAIQTRKQELFDELTEDEKRLIMRNKVKKGNLGLNKTAVNSGVKNLAEFHNAGYKGLYNGETANDIFKRKN